MDLNFSQRIRDVLGYSKEEAERLGNMFIAPEHIMLGLLREGEGTAIDILTSLNLDLSKIRQKLETKLKGDLPVRAESIPLLNTSERVLKLVQLEAKMLKSTEVNTGHLLMALLREKSTYL